MFKTVRSFFRTYLFKPVLRFLQSHIFESVLSFLQAGYPFLTNAWCGYWAYVGVEHHLYGRLAGLALFVVLNELDALKRLVIIRTQ